MSTIDEADEAARRLATRSLAGDDPTGWFERLYVAAERGEAEVPWDRGTPSQLLVEWTENRRTNGRGRRALVIGCGFGRDSEHVVTLGFDAVAFDIAASAIAGARLRHPDSAVHYTVADLLDPPADWSEAFDLVVESQNVQALPRALRATAIERVRGFVRPGGTLLVLAAALGDTDDPADGPPWPLTRDEVEAFAAGGLQAVRIEDLADVGDPPIRRWRGEFHRPV